MWNKWIYLYIYIYCILEQHRRSGKDLTCRRTCRILKEAESSSARSFWVEPVVSCCLHICNSTGEKFRSWGVVHMARCQLEEFDVPWCTQQICKQTRVTLFCMRLCAYMLQCYKHCEHFWLVPVAIQCWMQVHLCEDSRNNSQATSLFNQSRWHSNSVSYVSSRLIDHYVIFQVAVKVIRNFTQDLLRPFKCSVMIGYDRKSSVWVSWICYFENRWW